MSGPKRIIEHEEDPSTWKVDKNALHLRAGRLWKYMPVGCVCCVDSPDPKAKTFQSDEDEQLFVCGVHGPLEVVPYRSTRQYVVTIGELRVEGDQTLEDSFLFPRSLTPEKRKEMLQNLMDDAVVYEKERNPATDD